MRKTKEILRLKFEAGLGNHKIGRALGVSASTVWEALMRAQAMLKLGQREQAKALIKESRDEQGFKGQRDAFAKSLGAY